MAPLSIKKNDVQDFPGGPVVKGPPSNTGNSGSIPDQEIKIPHALRKLIPRATTREACVPRQKPSAVKKKFFLIKKGHK